MTAASQLTGAWLDAFTRQKPAAPWLQELREAAFQQFAELGFPTTHDEDWRFTNVAPIARTQFALAAPDQMYHAPEVVQELSLDDAKPFLGQQADFRLNAFVALNTAFIGGETRVLRVPNGVIVPAPIHITYESSEYWGQAAFHPRTLILVGANSQCTIIETYKGDGPHFTNAVTELVAGEGAIVDHYKVQQEGLTAFHVATLHATLGRSANFSTHNISLGGALVRNDIGVTLSEGTEAVVNGLYVVNGTQHVDNHTAIDHAKPHGTSHELYKGILDGRATAVFNGRIMVRKDAQKTDSKQTNKNLVLSDEAVIDTKPELQIFADDVRCTHGATIGQLDAESLFYLQSRGIPREQARNLLIYAFAQDIVDRIKVQDLKDSLERILFEKFHEHAQ